MIRGREGDPTYILIRDKLDRKHCMCDSKQPCHTHVPFHKALVKDKGVWQNGVRGSHQHEVRARIPGMC